MDVNTLIFAAMLFPTVAMIWNMTLQDRPNLRDSVTFVCALLTFACA